MSKLQFFLVREISSIYCRKINNFCIYLAGTLADLKKHRAQSRFTQGSGSIANGVNGISASAAATGGSLNGNGSMTPGEVIGGGSIVTATTNGFEDLDGHQKIPIELSLISAEDHNHYQSQRGEMMLQGNHNNNNNHMKIGSNLAESGATSLSNGSTKFSGIIAGDVVSDSTRSKRCCIVMWKSGIARNFFAIKL